MSWVRIDDKCHSHAKLVGAGNAAVGLWVRLLAWCSDHGTDGEIPACVVSMFGDGSGAECEALVRVGLLQQGSDTFVLHDFLDYNPSAKEVARLRKLRAIAGSKGGSKRQASCLPGASPLLPHCASKRQAKLNPDPDPDPDPRSDPEGRETPPPKRVRKKAPAGPMPDDWTPRESERAMAREYNLDLTLEIQSFKAWTKAKGATYSDWHAAFRNHLVSEHKRNCQRNDQGRRSEAEHQKRKAEGVPGLPTLVDVKPPAPLPLTRSQTPEVLAALARAREVQATRAREQEERRARAEAETEDERAARIEAERQRQKAALAAMGGSNG